MGEVMQFPDEEKKEKLLFTLRQTRKAYITEYFCGVLLLGMLGMLYYWEIPLETAFMEIIAGVGFVALFSAEASRIFTKYHIYTTKFSIVHGVLKQHKKNVYFQPLAFIPDLNVHQSRLQRLLNYGTVFIKTGGEVFEIKHVNNPQHVLMMIEDLIKQNKR